MISLLSITVVDECTKVSSKSKIIVFLSKRSVDFGGSNKFGWKISFDLFEGVKDDLCKFKGWEKLFWGKGFSCVIISGTLWIDDKLFPLSFISFKSFIFYSFEKKFFALKFKRFAK